MRHSDVEEDHIRPDALGRCDGLDAVRRGLDVAPGAPEQHRQARRGVRVVVGDDDLAHLDRLRAHRAARSRIGSPRRIRVARQPHDELRSPARTVAARGDRPAVQLDEAADERESDSEPSLGAVERPLDLREEVEHPWDHLGGDPDAGVAHTNHDVASIAVRGHEDPAALPGVLRRVVQEVADDLGEASQVAEYAQRVGRDLDGQRVVPCVDQRAARLDGARDDRRDLDRLAPEVDLPLRDAGDVEQVLDEPR